MSRLSPITEEILRNDPEQHQPGESDMDYLKRQAETTFARRSEIGEELLAKDPRLNPISAMVIAGDIQSAERSRRWVEKGAPVEEVANFVGSYARLGFIVDMWEEGQVDTDWVLDRLPDEWPGSDPDDTDPRFLRLWEMAFVRNGGKYVRDGKPLPRTKTIRIYRGQDADGEFGIAWSLSEETAEKFARGAATRQSNRGGTVFIADVPRKAIMAYLTRRGEDEVIIDPRFLAKGA